jgi:LacI family transcriptional regulator
MDTQRHPDKRPTITDVARAAGVSTTTVSYVLNERGHIGSAARDRVLAAATTLGYEPNVIARLLAGQRTRTLGLLFIGNAPDLFAPVARGVFEAAAAAGYSVFASGDKDPAREAAIIAAPIQHRVEGLILVAPSERRETVSRRTAQEHGIPLVVVNRPLAGSAAGVDGVHWDNVGGARLATEHLLDLGHRRLTYVGLGGYELVRPIVSS